MHNRCWKNKNTFHHKSLEILILFSTATPSKAVIVLLINLKPLSDIFSHCTAFFGKFRQVCHTHVKPLAIIQTHILI